MALMKIILILIYINSNTAQETVNTEVPQQVNTENLPPDQEDTICIVATVKSGSANLQQCYQINTVCKSESAERCKQQLEVNTEVPQQVNTENLPPDQEDTICIVATVKSGSANLQKCYQINTVCKSESAERCKQQLEDVCNNKVLNIYICERVTVPHLCDNCLETTISNCLTKDSTNAMTVSCSLTCKEDKMWTLPVQQVKPCTKKPVITSLSTNESTTTISQSAFDKSTEDTTQITQQPGQEKSSLNSGNKTNIGIAVGTSLGTICIICILAIVLIIRRKRSNPKKDIIELDKNHANANDYIGDQGVALPEIETLTEYCELNTRYNSHTYTDVKHVPIKTPETTYDYIDDLDRKHLSENSSDVMTKTSTFDLDKHLNVSENDTDCKILEREEVFADLMATAVNNISRADYAVLDPNETGFNRTGKSVTPTNEPYAVLDPTVTGYDRSHVGNGYDLAKAITTGNENNGSEQSTEDNLAYVSTFGQNENNYNTTNQQSKCQTNENVYNHSVDNVYDTATLNRKLEIPDNAYDHFVGKKTVDDYDMLKS